MYYVTNDDLIPLTAQPDSGYEITEAIERREREAKMDAFLFDSTLEETLQYYHIIYMDEFNFAKII